MITAVAIAAFIGLYMDWRLSLDNTESLFEKFFMVSFSPYLIYFGIGIFWFKMWERTYKHYLLAIAGVVLYWSMHLDIFSISSFMFFDFLKIFPLSYSVLWFGFNAPRFFRNLTNFGDISYGVYIWHMVVVNVFLYYGWHQSFNSNLVSLAVFGMTSALALLSWKFIEKPALSMKKFSSKSSQINNPRSKL